MTLGDGRHRIHHPPRTAGTHLAPSGRAGGRPPGQTPGTAGSVDPGPCGTARRAVGRSAGPTTLEDALLGHLLGLFG
ncbi:hypothetical protein ACIRA2_20145 [Streptomyces griseoviridis]